MNHLSPALPRKPRIGTCSLRVWPLEPVTYSLTTPKGGRLGRRVLRQVATIVTPETILRWHRRLIAWK
jgi:hypothetical protein